MLTLPGSDFNNVAVCFKSDRNTDVPICLYNKERNALLWEKTVNFAGECFIKHTRYKFAGSLL